MVHIYLAVCLFIGKGVIWLLAWAIAGYVCMLVTGIVAYVLQDVLRIKHTHPWSDEALEDFVMHYVERVFREGTKIQYLFPATFGLIFFPIALALVLGETILVHPFRAWSRRRVRATRRQAPAYAMERDPREQWSND